jgi:hypothetical protein
VSAAPRFLSVALLAVVGVASACGDGDAPVAEIIGHAPSTLTPGDDTRDDLTLEVHYADADGDLGQGAVLVHDCHGGVTERTSLPAIASPEAVDAGVEIEGDLQVIVADVGAVQAGPTPEACGGDTGAFCVVLVDAAGNESDPACVSGIVLADE